MLFHVLFILTARTINPLNENTKATQTSQAAGHIVDGIILRSCLHYVLPDGNYTATTREPHCKYASCAECKNYSNDCVCEMVKPQYCIEGKLCELFTRCIPREQSCLLSPCFPGFRCELADVTCVKAPCWPTKRCAPAKCPPNEEWNDCGTCQPICGQPIPFCPAICGRAGCQCIEGFSRNDSVCVPSSSCS